MSIIAPPRIKNFKQLTFERKEVFTIQNAEPLTMDQMFKVWELIVEPGTTRDDVIFSTQIMYGTFRRLSGTGSGLCGIFRSTDGISFTDFNSVFGNTANFVPNVDTLDFIAMFSNFPYFGFGASTNNINTIAEMKDVKLNILAYLPPNVTLRQVK